MDTKAIEGCKGQLKAADTDLITRRIDALKATIANPQTIQEKADVASKRDQMDMFIELAEAELAGRGK